jgi:hypothetical protein
MSQGQPNPNVVYAASQKVMPIFTGDMGAADEGSYFVSTLAPTAGTAVACTTQALADTNPSIALYNGNASGGFNTYLRYIKARVTAVGGSNTSKNYSAILDNVLAKLTTTGTALGTPQNVNTGSSTAAKTQLNAGVLIAAAASANVRRVGDGQVGGSVEVAFDEWIFTFGDSANKNLIGTTTLVSARVVPLPPVILAPGWWFTLGLWGASQAAAADTIGWEVGFIERPSGQ